MSRPNHHNEKAACDSAVHGDDHFPLGLWCITQLLWIKRRDDLSTTKRQPVPHRPQDAQRSYTLLHNPLAHLQWYFARQSPYRPKWCSQGSVFPRSWFKWATEYVRKRGQLLTQRASPAQPSTFSLFPSPGFRQAKSREARLGPPCMPLPEAWKGNANR